MNFFGLKSIDKITWFETFRIFATMYSFGMHMSNCNMNSFQTIKIFANMKTFETIMFYANMKSFEIYSENETICL